MPENSNFTIYKSNKLENFLPDVIPIIERLSKKTPLKKKNIVVQSDGMARWLTVKAASKIGAFANFDFISPDGFLKNFAEEHFGIKPDSVYNKKNAEWELYSLLKNEKEGLAATYIRNDGARAFRLARILADMIEQYFVYRPGMMESWRKGKVMTDDPDEAWQFEIFRKLSEKTATASFARLFNEKCMEAVAQSDHSDELILFGISIMNKYQLDMFRNLSRLFPIHLFAMTPSMEFYRKSRQKGSFLDPEENNGEFDTFFGRFCAASLDFLSFTLDNPSFEKDDFEEPAGNSLLALIQRDILNDAEKPESAGIDDSVRIVSCRDKMREIEVVKDTLLELFNNDDTLKPEDVAVMAPKINDYAPYITAVFGGTDPQDKTFIPWVISDRSFSNESRIAATFLDMLRLAGSDFEKSKVFSIFRSPFVCTKFNIDEQSAGDIEKIVCKSGVKWGLDAESRGGDPQNTWDFGLSRIMMSFFMPFSENGEGFSGILPMKDVSRDDLESVSSFITFAKELFRCSQELASSEMEPAEFKKKFEWMLDFFFVCDRSDRDSCEEMRHIRSVIDDFAETAERSVKKLSFDAVLQYLEDELGRERSGRGFLSANVNFCSLKPLRALPFRVIYLVGMGDGEFPRSENRYAFDLTQKKYGNEPDAPQPRSVRDNDKYLFAEAVVSAREKLIISYEAEDFSEDSKKHRSAAMPVQILKKYIAKKTGKETGELETKYPVQPFSEEYFRGNGFKTFSKKDFEIAHAMFHVEQNAPSVLPERTSEEETESYGSVESEALDLEKLISFFKDPEQYYFTKILKISLPDDKDKRDDEELFDYSDNLIAYNVRKTYIDMAQSMPEAFFDDRDKFEKAFFDRMKCEGVIPFGTFGEAALRGLITDPDMSNLAEKIAGKDLVSEHISISFDDLNTKLEGVVKNIERSKEGCDRMIIVSPTGAKEKHLIGAMIRHLAANAAGLKVDTEFFCNKENYLLEHKMQADAKRSLSQFMQLWLSAKKAMPLFDPELICEIGKLLKKSRDGGVPDEDTLREKVCGFFEERWRKRIDPHYFPSQGFLLTAEQFLQRKDSFLDRFPFENVLEAAKIFKEFFLLDKKDGRKKK